MAPMMDDVARELASHLRLKLRWQAKWAFVETSGEGKCNTRIGVHVILEVYPFLPNNDYS